MNVIDRREGTNTRLDSQTQRRTAASGTEDFSRIASEGLLCEVLHCVLHSASTPLRHIPFQLLNMLNEAACICELQEGKKKLASSALTANPTDNRLPCQSIKSHSGWQKPNTPLTLSFWKSDLKHSGARRGDRTTSCFQDLFCRHAALPQPFLFGLDGEQLLNC